MTPAQRHELFEASVITDIDQAPAQLLEPSTNDFQAFELLGNEPEALVTSAVYLAEAASADRSVLLVDADPQRSASRWAEDTPGGLGSVVIGLPSKTLKRDIERVGAGYTHVIIDTRLGRDRHRGIRACVGGHCRNADRPVVVRGRPSRSDP